MVTVTVAGLTRSGPCVPDAVELSEPPSGVDPLVRVTVTLYVVVLVLSSGLLNWSSRVRVKPVVWFAVGWKVAGHAAPPTVRVQTACVAAAGLMVKLVLLALVRAVELAVKVKVPALLIEMSLKVATPLTAGCGVVPFTVVNGLLVMATLLVAWGRMLPAASSTATWNDAMVWPAVVVAAGSVTQASCMAVPSSLNAVLVAVVRPAEVALRV